MKKFICVLLIFGFAFFAIAIISHNLHSKFCDGFKSKYTKQELDMIGDCNN